MNNLIISSNDPNNTYSDDDISRTPLFFLMISPHMLKV